MGQRIELLQNNPDMAKQFLHTEGVSLGEGSAVAPLRALLLDPNSVMAKSYAANLASMPNNAGLSRLAAEGIGNFRLNPMEPLAQAERALASLEAQTLSEMPDTLSPQARESIANIMKGGGGTNLGTQTQMLLGQLSDGKVGTSISDARDVLTQERNRLNRGVIAPTFGPGGGGTFQDPNAQKSVDRLDKVIDVLNRSLEQAEKQAALQAETNRKLGEGGIPVTNN